MAAIFLSRECLQMRRVRESNLEILKRKHVAQVFLDSEIFFFLSETRFFV
ncbi:hypothetical protein Bca4012_042838 [Brassica carinata]